LLVFKSLKRSAQEHKCREEDERGQVFAGPQMRSAQRMLYVCHRVCACADGRRAFLLCLSETWLLEDVEKVPDAGQAKLAPAKAGIQSHNEAYFLYVE
jgi:hypothetical protein